MTQLRQRSIRSLFFFTVSANQAATTRSSSSTMDSTHFCEAANQTISPCFVVMPQTVDGFSNYGISLTALISALHAASAHNGKIDTDRIFVTGLSMGGGGTVQCLTERPGP
jgi:predicted peptidase